MNRRGNYCPYNNNMGLSLKKKSRSKFVMPKFNPETDDNISYYQVVYGKYENGNPVINRVYVFEDFSFAVPKSKNLI